jgi:peptidoglycan/xylan/chitin deacetylase (PgdA/CDA1 family)
MVRPVALCLTLAAVLVASATATAAPASREPVPILMYHAIRTAPAGARLPSLFVRPKLFAAQVRALRRAGYHAVTMQRAWDAWHGDATLPRRPIVLSFDDGYPSQVGVALPVLRREGWPGVLNLTLSYLDEIGGAGAVRRLIDAGWEIDAHTRTHPDLTHSTDTRLEDEVAAARTEIADRFGVEANFFCYPGGAYDARVVAAVRKAGYLAATTTHMGFATPAAPYTLKRVTVDGGSDAPALLRRLAKLRARY